MDFIDDFIQEYKNSPCLWKADSLNYKNRSKRQEAYMRLIEVASKHGEHYNVERTKQKINNLRCAFRHQLKKYNELKSKGEKEEPYCPKRKYFESLMFLKDEESRDKRLKTDHHVQQQQQQHHHHHHQNTTMDTMQQQQQQHCPTTSVVHTQQQHVKQDIRLSAMEQDPNSSTTSTLTISSVGGGPGATGTVEILETIDPRNGAVGTTTMVDTLHMPNNLFNDLCKEIHKDNGETETEEELSALDERGGGGGTGGGPTGHTLILEKDNSNTVNISVISSEKGLALSSQDLEEITAMTSTPMRKDHHHHHQHQQHLPQHQQQQQQHQHHPHPQQLYIMDTSSALPPASTIITNNMITTPKTQVLGLTTSKVRKRSSSFSSQHSNETEDNTNSMAMTITTTPTPTGSSGILSEPSGGGIMMNKAMKSSSSEVSLDLDHLITLACKNLPGKFAANSSNNDHYNSVGDIVAHKLRTMDSKQALYAEKIISDVLYLGQMKYLTAASIDRCSWLEATTTTTTSTSTMATICQNAMATTSSSTTVAAVSGSGTGSGSSSHNSSMNTIITANSNGSIIHAGNVSHNSSNNSNNGGNNGNDGEGGTPTPTPNNNNNSNNMIIISSEGNNSNNSNNGDGNGNGNMNDNNNQII